MLREFPLLLPVDEKGLHYDGYIKVCKRLFQLEVSIPRTGRLSDASINCDWHLQQILGRFTAIIKQRLKQCCSLVSFLKELHSIIERQLEAEDSKPEHTSKFCSHLITHIETLGWNRLVFIDPSFQELHMQHVDEQDRKHILRVNIGGQYPKEPPKCHAEIPGKFEVHWTQQSQLIDIYNQFSQCVATYKGFWDMMGEIDKNTWVLEPEKPTYSAVHRRIAISTNASIQITVDPLQPRTLPECRFLGAEQVVSPLRESMNSNLNMWNEEITLLENLQALLGITFPSPATTKKEEFNVECGICYSYRMELEIPDEVCSDTRCGQAFHRTCLYEWLRALPSSRQSFNTIFGECPYCEKAITVKMPLK